MLMAGSSARQFANIVVSILAILFFGWGLTIASGLSFLCCLLGIAYSINSVALAVGMIDRIAPVLSAGRNGLVFTSAISSEDIVHWDDVRILRVLEMPYPLPLPLFSWIVVRSRRRFVSGWARFLPSSWFGAYYLPTRLLRGGSRSARQFVRIVNGLREEDRHDLAHGGNGQMVSDASLRWGVMRNTEFPVGKEGLSDTVLEHAMSDALLESAGVHRDVLPRKVEEQLRNSEAVSKLADKGREWGREAARELREERDTRQGAKPRQPAFGRRGGASPPGYGRQTVYLNGEPIEL